MSWKQVIWPQQKNSFHPSFPLSVSHMVFSKFSLIPLASLSRVTVVASQYLLSSGQKQVQHFRRDLPRTARFIVCSSHDAWKDGFWPEPCLRRVMWEWSDCFLSLIFSMLFNLMTLPPLSSALYQELVMWVAISKPWILERITYFLTLVSLTT